jgi:hypothetical protein
MDWIAESDAEHRTKLAALAAARQWRYHGLPSRQRALSVPALPLRAHSHRCGAAVIGANWFKRLSCSR